MPDHRRIACHEIHPALAVDQRLGATASVKAESKGPPVLMEIPGSSLRLPLSNKRAMIDFRLACENYCENYQ
jgi:hypothetical protein